MAELKSTQKADRDALTAEIEERKTLGEETEKKMAAAADAVSVKLQQADTRFALSLKSGRQELLEKLAVFEEKLSLQLVQVSGRVEELQAADSKLAESLAQLRTLLGDAQRSAGDADGASALQLAELETKIKAMMEDVQHSRKTADSALLTAGRACDNCASISATAAAGAAGTGAGDSGVDGGNVGEVRVLQLVRGALQLYGADGTGRPDFALESAGGSVVGTRCTETYTDMPSTVSLLGVPLFKLSRSPRTAIQPNLHPGECWAFRGTAGHLVVRLSAKVRVTAVTLDHMPRSLSPTGELASAPQNFTVAGLKHESEPVGVVLGRFRYDEHGPSLQTFQIPAPSLGSEHAAYSLVEFHFLNNYGHPNYTCIYRVRVHGEMQRLGGH